MVEETRIHFSMFIKNGKTNIRSTSVNKYGERSIMGWFQEDIEWERVLWGHCDKHLLEAQVCVGDWSKVEFKGQEENNLSDDDEDDSEMETSESEKDWGIIVSQIWAVLCFM